MTIQREEETLPSQGRKSQDMPQRQVGPSASSTSIKTSQNEKEDRQEEENGENNNNNNQYTNEAEEPEEKPQHEPVLEDEPFIPEVSKWEREEGFDSGPDEEEEEEKKRRKVPERKENLPRFVIEQA